MRILVACEFSGIVRDAFSERGHYAISCDLLPSERGGLHYHGDIFQCIKDCDPFDALTGFPTCTYLIVSCNTWFREEAKASPGILTGEARRIAMLEAVEFVKRLWSQKIPKMAIENPVGRLSSLWMKPTQIIQTWMFGHGETKKTCLWLRGFPLLQPTHRKDDLFCEPEPVEREQRIFRMARSEKRSMERSRTYSGVASAMAHQWG